MIADCPLVLFDISCTGSIPSHWDKSGNELVEIDATDPLYHKVVQQFQRTCQRAILKIERIQKQNLYVQYQAKKSVMDGPLSSSSQSGEMRLYHGTDPITAQKIVTQGFNRSFAGKNGRSCNCLVGCLSYALQLQKQFAS